MSVGFIIHCYSSAIVSVAVRCCDCHDIVCFFFLPLFLLCFNWLCRWNEINNMSHNRSFFALELANREESVQFQTVSLCCYYTFSSPSIPRGIAFSYWIWQNCQWPLWWSLPSASLNNTPVCLCLCVCLGGCNLDCMSVS